MKSVLSIITECYIRSTPIPEEVRYRCDFCDAVISKVTLHDYSLIRARWCINASGQSGLRGRKTALHKLHSSGAWVCVVQALAGCGEGCGLPMPVYRSWQISAC